MLLRPDLIEAIAEHSGFISLPSRPDHPQEQDVQERSGGYVHDKACKGHSFETLEAMNDYLAALEAPSRTAAHPWQHCLSVASQVCSI